MHNHSTCVQCGKKVSRSQLAIVPLFYPVFPFAILHRACVQPYLKAHRFMLVHRVLSGWDLNLAFQKHAVGYISALVLIFAAAIAKTAMLGEIGNPLALTLLSVLGLIVILVICEYAYILRNVSD